MVRSVVSLAVIGLVFPRAILGYPFNNGRVGPNEFVQNGRNSMDSEDMVGSNTPNDGFKLADFEFLVSASPLSFWDSILAGWSACIPTDYNSCSTTQSNRIPSSSRSDPSQCAQFRQFFSENRRLPLLSAQSSRPVVILSQLDAEAMATLFPVTSLPREEQLNLIWVSAYFNPTARNEWVETWQKYYLQNIQEMGGSVSGLATDASVTSGKRFVDRVVTTALWSLYVTSTSPQEELANLFQQFEGQIIRQFQAQPELAQAALESLQKSVMFIITLAFRQNDEGTVWALFPILDEVIDARAEIQLAGPTQGSVESASKLMGVIEQCYSSSGPSSASPSAAAATTGSIPMNEPSDRAGWWGAQPESNPPVKIGDFCAQNLWDLEPFYLDSKGNFGVKVPSMVLEQEVQNYGFSISDATLPGSDSYPIVDAMSMPSIQR
ncbi:hypothetical protein H4R33_004609 [Dimargaris cristalligena]|uniref:Uncharacterized protein n=1 Tax=Dimargaris cristalligena TaxID=215637 RepID=A0A4P9ZWB1_9FUNG|nr:hypothetical protein H4R33_004609 [Dimargaris cristalligena]RKP37907.1 hypothetical protein BJ085DRAFT_28857 [Dimargaris cristalligena]|eukprot:RKP37907.1 hypothetical protein BJ085DRAFT_28857 [Dimargaris cristalligena]